MWLWVWRGWGRSVSGRGGAAACAGGVQRRCSAAATATEENHSGRGGESDDGRQPQKFPRGHWRSEEHVRLFVERLRERHGVHSLEDWRHVTTADVAAEVGGAALLAHKGSLAALLAAADVASEAEKGGERGGLRRLARILEGRRTAGRSAAYWDVGSRRRAALLSLATTLRLPDAEDPRAWRHVGRREVERHIRGGATLLQRFGGSLVAALADAFPGRGFHAAACRRRVPDGHWAEVEHRRQFLEALAATRHHSSDTDALSHVTAEEVRAAGGGGLLQRYGGSVIRLLHDTFPGRYATDAEEADRRSRRPVGHWSSRWHRREALEAIGRALNAHSPEEWAAVTVDEVRALGGGGLLRHYGGSLWDALVDTFGNHFRPHVCRPRVPSRAWEAPEQLRAFLEEAARALDVRGPEDWMRLSRTQLLSVRGGRSLLASCTLLDALRQAFPEQQWPEAAPLHAKKASQRHLARALEAVFA